MKKWNEMIFLKIEATPKEIADLIDELKKPTKIKNYDCVPDEGRKCRGESITNPLSRQIDNTAQSF